MALINFFVPDAALIRGRRLIEGSAYSSKYGNLVAPLHLKKLLKSSNEMFRLAVRSRVEGGMEQSSVFKTISFLKLAAKILR